MDIGSITDILVSLLTLTFLEIVLGVDNLVFIAIISQRLPIQQQKLARRLGLVFALGTRLLLLAGVFWLAHLTEPLFSIAGYSFSARDLILLGGGLFLLYKATQEIHIELSDAEEKVAMVGGGRYLSMVILQIAVLDIIFSIDSVLTAVAMTPHFWLMAAAITITILLMIFASEFLSRIVQTYPTVKMLAFSFLLLVGTVLIADGFHFHVPRAYVYFAICFSLFVEILNSTRRKKRLRKHTKTINSKKITKDG